MVAHREALRLKGITVAAHAGQHEQQLLLVEGVAGAELRIFRQHDGGVLMGGQVARVEELVAETQEDAVGVLHGLFSCVCVA